MTPRPWWHWLLPWRWRREPLRIGDLCEPTRAVANYEPFDLPVVKEVPGVRVYRKRFPRWAGDDLLRILEPLPNGMVLFQFVDRTTGEPLQKAIGKAAALRLLRRVDEAALRDRQEADEATKRAIALAVKQ